MSEQPSQTERPVGADSYSAPMPDLGSAEWLDALAEDGFGYWLAGFLDGEGAFIVGDPSTRTRYRCGLRVDLRADDRAALDMIVGRTGIGRVFLRKMYRTDGIRRQQQVVWQAARRDDVRALVLLLDRFPLRAKKARDYAIWRRAVLAWLRVPAHTKLRASRRELDRTFTNLHAELDAVRAYPEET